MALATEDRAALIRRMTPEHRAEVEAILDAEVNGPKLAPFIEQVSPHLPPPEHVRALAEVIEQARRERLRVCLSWPPRHAKTTTILHGFAWWLSQVPADTCAYYTYSDRQARSKSRLARAIAERGGVKIAADTNDMSEWRTPNGGGLLAGGVGGGLTGQGVSGVFVVDDPYKNRADADSPVYREKVEEWFNEVVMTRLEGASVIVIHTRWRDDDLIGRLGDGSLGEAGTWDVVNLPALAEEDDVLGRDPGDALWPDRFPAEELEGIARQIGDWSFAALYQGRPRPRGANVFGEPRYYDPATFDPKGCVAVIAADPAASEKTTADYSSAVVLAVRLEERGAERLPVAYVLDVYRRQVSIPEFVNALRVLQAKWYNARIGVEAVGGFKAVPQMLRQVDPSLRVVEIPPRGDKFQRSQPVAAAWNDGRVLVPTSAAWLGDFAKEVCSFSGVRDAHDDQVDALAHAWNQIAFAPPPVRRGVRASPSRWK